MHRCGQRDIWRCNEPSRAGGKVAEYTAGSPLLRGQPMVQVESPQPASQIPRIDAVVRAIAVQVEEMSPDHTAPAKRCCPAKPERVRMTTRWSGAEVRWPS